MKSLDNSTVTAHALGELDVPQQHLLRMTFSSPAEAAALEEECAEILGLAAVLRTALRENPPQLSTAQRMQVLSRTAATASGNMDGAFEHRQHRERRRYERGPAWKATLVTAGAAAAIMVLLAQLRTDQSAVPQRDAVAVDEEAFWDPGAPRFKIKPPRKETDTTAKNPQKLAAGLPQSMQDLAVQPSLPHGLVPVPGSAETLAGTPQTTPPPATVRIEVPKVNPQPDPAPSSSRVPRPGPLPGEKSFAAPKE
ncbi:MAG: hypothetical protein KA004_02850 [Verrucomicrobiales bacterium]|nr:hypothetical protein [Verrucomicrobiales bacterium]